MVLLLVVMIDSEGIIMEGMADGESGPRDN